MTPEETLRIARESGGEEYESITPAIRFPVSRLVDFTSQIERETIEACAKACDEMAAKHHKDPSRNDHYSCADARAEVCEELADAMRALLPAPASSADTPKCGTCKDEPYGEFAGLNAAGRGVYTMKPCPDCTPASNERREGKTKLVYNKETRTIDTVHTPARAEQKCVCAIGNTETVCSKNMKQVANTGAALLCPECNHSGACHEGATP